MKPPARPAGAKASPSSGCQIAAGWQGGSHIPLPLRRSSTKSEKANDGEEIGIDAEASKDRPRAMRAAEGRYGNTERGGGKMSLLGSTSFCCASGQKEDCGTRDSQMAPVPRPQKRKPKNGVKKDSDMNAESSGSTPAAVKKITTPRTRRAKVDNDSVDTKDALRTVECSPKSRRSSVAEEKSGKALPNNQMYQNNKLKLVEGVSLESSQSKVETKSEEEQQSGKGGCADSGVSHKQEKYKDVFQKLRKNPSHCTTKNIMALNVENKLYDKRVRNYDDRSDLGGDEKILLIDSCPDERRDARSVKNEVEDSDAASTNKKEDGIGSEQADNSHGTVFGREEDCARDNCDKDDLDCPCCDNIQEESAVDESLIENRSQDLVCRLEKEHSPITSPIPLGESIPTCSSGIAEVQEKDGLEQEVTTLKEELEQERLKLQSQQGHVLQLEKEMEMMEQLKLELIREKQLRKEAEMRLLEVLDREKRSPLDESQASDILEETTSELTKQESIINSDVSQLEDESSPLLLGYESRVRWYQMYIAKLEKDNIMLVNELKHLKDLSPCSQKEQAKTLLEKLGQLERDSQQQQVQYESCLDEVANRLVQTLLTQKRLEEECKELHRRVQQLEAENKELVEMVDVTGQKMVKTAAVLPKGFCNQTEEPKLQMTPLTTELIILPLLATPKLENIDASSQRTFTETKKEILPSKIAIATAKQFTAKNAKNRDPQPVDIQHPTEDVASSTKHPCASRIPAFNNPSFSRIKTKSNINLLTEEQQNFHQSSSLPTVNDLKNETDSSSPAAVPNTTNIKVEPNLMNNISDAVDYTKLSSVKRKRLTRLGSTFDKGTKEVRLKSKSQHIQWDQAIKSEGELKDEPFSKTVRKFRTNLLLQAENQTDIWNFNCVMKEPAVINTLPKDLLRQKDMVNTYSSNDVKECDSENCSPKVFSPLPETDSSASTDGVHRTRDEGYSTMSSDLQPDSVADTTMSEQSATYIASETALHCSDDSVTECLDGSMSSSSDSGFGPLQNFAKNSLPHLEDSAVEEDSSDSQKESDYSPVTAKCKPLSGEHVSEQLAGKQKIKFMPEATDKQQISLIAKQVKFKPQFSRFTFDNASFVQNDENTYQDSHPVSYQGPKDAWTRTDCDDVSFYCSKKIPNFIQEEKVETAEKATLTEPEEELWREKALAHFIDESIWSLYSSESDIHLKPLSDQFSCHQSVEDLDYQISPAQKEQYPSTLLTKMSDKSTSSVEDTYDASEMPQNSKHQHLKSSVTTLIKDTLTDDVQNLIQDQSKLHFSAPSLERVASDTVLYLKDSFRELEISMKPGLKTTKIAPKNIPLFHHLSISDIAMQSERETKSILDSEILKKLHNSMLVQNTLHWPLQTNNSRSTSLSSVQSSTSCHVISDEMDDDDIIHTSRKGSQDPDLSSASDVEHENLEHKDFVEQWLQKEISQDDSRSKGDFKLEKGTWSLQDANDCFEAINEIKPLLSSPDLSLPSSDLSPDGVCGSPTTLHDTHISSFLPAQSSHSDSQILLGITESDESKDHDFCTVLPTCEVPCASSSVCGHIESHINQLTPSSEETHSLSSTLYPILCCHDNFPEGNAKLCECVSSNGTNQVHDLDEEGQADSLEPEVKAFNKDFYRLCSVGSLKSLEAFIPSSSDCMESQEICLKQYSNSPKFKRSPIMKYRDPFAKNVVLDHKRYKHFEGKANKMDPSHLMHPYNLLSVSNDKSDSNYQKEDVNKYASVFHSPPVSQQLSCSSNSYFHPNSLCTNEHKSACLSRLKGSLPKQTISSDNQQNNMSMVSLSFQNTIKESAGQKMCLNGQDLPLYSTERLQPAILSSPEIKIPNSNCSAVSPDQKPNRIHPQGIINSPRTDAVSRRQQLRRERWNARQNRIKEGCGTAWVHVHANADLTDPKARASLLDSMMATSSSGSSTDEEEEMLVIHNNSQLQRICRERRHKAKASGKDEFFALSPRIRSSIMNRHGLYYRYGEQEKEAIACFDFLEELSTSTSEVGSMELLNNRLMIPPHYDVHDGKNYPIDRTATSSSTSRSQLSSFSARLRLPGLWNKPLSHNMSSSTLNSQDCELLDHISLSDSCAESYSSTPDSYEEAS